MDSRVMTNTYRQLTLDQRYQIQSDKAAGFSPAETAERIGCHRSTVYRELGSATIFAHFLGGGGFSLILRQRISALLRVV